MRDNYIPIRRTLRRSVLQQGCRFDPELEIYEDWDFWLQLTQLGFPYRRNQRILSRRGRITDRRRDQ